jgi:hypothetical protein
MGVYSAKDLPTGTVIMSIPFADCISTESIIQSEALRHIFAEQQGLTDYPDEVLAIAIMFASLPQGAACPWADHVRTFPAAGEMNSTIFWSAEELELVRGCTVYHLTTMMQRQIKADWAGLYTQLLQAYPAELAGATEELYQWALSMVYSRAVGLHRAGLYTRVIAPVLDLANHNPSVGAETADTFFFDEAADMLQFKAAVDVRSGEECFAMYGPYPNAKLAYTYGFVVHKQRYQAVDLWTRVSPSSSNAAAKQNLLQGQPFTALQTYDFTGTLRPDFISGALLSTVRVMQASPAELQGLLGGQPYIGNMVSVANEARTYSSLRELLVARLEVDKVEADLQTLGKLLLDGVAHSDRRVMALIIQVEERDLVQASIRLVDRCQEKLQELGESYKPLDCRTGQPSVH